jgi:hypothetical protein
LLMDLLALLLLRNSQTYHFSWRKATFFPEVAIYECYLLKVGANVGSPLSSCHCFSLLHGGMTPFCHTVWILVKDLGLTV